MALYKASCGREFESKKDRKNVINVIMKTDKDFLKSPKIDPPKECISCLKLKRKPYRIEQYDVEKREMHIIKTWRCRFTKVGEKSA